MKTRTWKVLWAVAAMFSWAGQAAADDVLPPCWRGRPDTTLQHWRFDANANPAAPEIVTNPHGSPALSVQSGQAAAGYITQLFLFGTNQGIWDLGLGGTMTVTVPNQARPAGSWKLVSVQVYQYLDGIYSQPAAVSVPGATRVGGLMRTNTATLFGNWVADQSVWRIEPCPASETIVITGGTNGAPSSAIDQVVVDTLCLSITCPPNLTLAADTGQCSRSNVTWALPAADGCVLTNVTCSPTNRSTFPVGATPVSCVVRDAYGHTVNCSFTVTVADAEPPAANCPADLAVPANPGLCGETVSFTATASDNCPGVTIACVPESGSFFPVGGATVICTARDAAGLTSQCSFQVTVIAPPSAPGDAFPPCWRGGTGTTHQDWAFNTAANPAAPEVFNNPDGTPLATVLPGAFSADWQDRIPGLGCRQGIWDLGTNGLIFLDITNRAGPASSYKYVRVQITQWQDGGLFGQLAAVSFPNIPGATLVSRPPPMTVEAVPPLGRWVVDSQVWRLAPCPDTELIQVLGAPRGSLIDEVIVDTFCMVPAVCPTDITGDADPGSCVKTNIVWSLPAADGCVIRSVACRTNGVVVTQPASFPIGQTVVNCAITDAEGQTNTCNFTVTISDIEPPVIVSCASPITLPANASCAAPVPDFTGGVSATDCSAFTTSQAPAVGTPLGLGIHPVTLTVTDAGGLSVSCITTLTVIDTTPPTFTMTAPDQSAPANASCQAAAPDVAALSAATDNCDPTVTLSQSPAAGTLVGLGVTVITVTATDDAGNAATDTVNFTVSDTTAPVITTCAPTQSANANGSCVATVPDFTASQVATDCNGPLMITQSPAAGTLVGLGPTAVTVMVKDAANNVATCATTFTVNDVTAPVIDACAPPQSASTDAVNCQAAVPDFSGGVVATDCNGPLAITQSPAAGTLVGLGTTAVTLTVKDAANNAATCPTTFTVEPVADLSVQVVSAPEPVTVGQPVSYTVTVSNLGACPASGVIVNNVLSAGQVLVSVTDPGTSVARACPTPGPSVWYRAEGNASDSVGVNHGTINGGVTFGPQVVAQGFSFDGLTGYISVPDGPALRPASLTIEGWIEIGDPNGLHVVLSKPQGSGLADSYSLWIASGVLNAAISDGTGSGPFLTYPNFPTSSIFLFSDITDLPSLANKLKTPAPADLVSQYLNSQLSAETLALLAAYAGGPDTPLQRHIVADFNLIIQNGPLYTPARFAGVTLSAETLYVLGRNPTGIDLVRLNRLLIRDTYPAEIVMNLFPQLNQRYHIAYTFDPATQKQALYVDGELVDSSFVTKTITYANRPLVLGAGENAGSAADYFYQGELDELAIYNRALTGIEVQGIHGAGANGKCFNTGPVVLGSLAGGASQTFTVVAVPTTCPIASLQATVSGTETDPVLANNTATANAIVAELDPSQLRLSIRRISVNNDHVGISWPITCAPFVLETTDDLSPFPIIWTPASVPVLILQGRYSTVIPASEAHRFFRLRNQ